MAKRDYNIRAMRYVAVVEEPISGTQREAFSGAEKAVTERAKEEIQEALSGVEVEPYTLIAHIVRVTEYHRGETKREHVRTVTCEVEGGA